MTKHSKVLTFFLAFSFVLSLAAIAQQAEETVVCAVSGHKIKKSEAKITHEYKGKTYYFCSEKCKEEFLENPEKYIQKKEEMKAVYTCPMHPEVKSDKPGKCSKCGMKLEKKMMHKEKMEHKEQMMHKEKMEHKEKMHAHMHKQTHMHREAKEKQCCPMMGMMGSEDIEMTVENTKDGIVVKVTSKNEETVKKIQEMASKMKECCQEEGEKAKTCKKEVKKEEVKKEVIEK
ncbi:MAG: YHS domain-containing protein [Candidatus Aminicenantes bacterium]|nr:YHS domain-containing protein [Candidatus Aminicenantes bacterium]